MNTHLTAQVTAGFNDVFGSYSTDALIIIIALAAFFAFGFFAGKTKFVTLIISLYVTAVAFLAFPYTSNVSVVRGVPNAAAWSALIVFVVLLALVFFAIKRIILTGESFGKAKYIHNGILSLSALLAVVGLSYTILPFGSLFRFSAAMTGFVNTPLVLFAFVVLPLMAIYAANRY